MDLGTTVDVDTDGVRRHLTALTLLSLSVGALAACGDDSPEAAAPTSAAAPATTSTDAIEPTTSVLPTTVPTTSGPTEPATSATAAPAPVLDAEALTALVEADAARLATSPGQIVTVRSPSRGIDLTVAVGSTDFGGAPLASNDSFRIASVTKTFTAAATMRLVEQGVLSLEDNLTAAGVPAELVDMLRSDGYDVDAMTVAQLLDHSSGAFDYAFGDGVAYVDAVLADPGHRWTRGEQVAFAVEHGDPLGAPGTVSQYSDTGYVLLGAILEARTGLSYGDAMAELLGYDALGLTHTVWEAPGAEPVTERVHQYYGEQDTIAWDASIDLFGGGGLVSTTADLATFFGALERGEVFDDADTFSTMSTVVGPDPMLAKGLFIASDGERPCFFHEGFWGVLALTCPDLDLTIARSWMQAVPAEGWTENDLLLEIVAAVRG